jgi:hypothetical protein
VARDTIAAESAGVAKLMARVYWVIRVVFTGPNGSPIALLWPERAVASGARVRDRG